MKKYLKTIASIFTAKNRPELMYYSAILMAIIVTFSLVIRYSSGLMPFSHIDWLMVPMVVFTTLWTERFSPNLTDRKKAATMDLIIDIIYFVAIGSLVSMLMFQALHEMIHPVTGFKLYLPWLMIAMFGYVIFAGPVAEFRYCYKINFRITVTQR